MGYSQFEFTDLDVKYGNMFDNLADKQSRFEGLNTSMPNSAAPLLTVEELEIRRKFAKLPNWKFKRSEYPKRNLVPFLDLESLSYGNKF